MRSATAAAAGPSSLANVGAATKAIFVDSKISTHAVTPSLPTPAVGIPVKAAQVDSLLSEIRCTDLLAETHSQGFATPHSHHSPLCDFSISRQYVGATQRLVSPLANRRYTDSGISLPRLWTDIYEERLNRLIDGHDPQPPEKVPRRASKPPRGRPRSEDAEATQVDFPMAPAAHQQQPLSPSHTSPPNSSSPLSPPSTPPLPFLPRSVSMDHRTIPRLLHPAPHIPARRESVPLPALSPSTIDDTMRQFAQDFHESTFHPPANYELSPSQLVTIPPRALPGSQQDRSWHPSASQSQYHWSFSPQPLLPIPPRGVLPTQQRWASRSPPGVGQYSSSPAFLEPFPVLLRLRRLRPSSFVLSLRSSASSTGDAYDPAHLPRATSSPDIFDPRPPRPKTNPAIPPRTRVRLWSGDGHPGTRCA
ncbi:hypothetical protein M427DRAFT_73127 [Gonapodya prolifera JEL478]|uniref:Uncharacterized protein n=1 Tax=Gonapodya prolifera (strain JEL478) TaxID=1344416 RepID=A0A139A3A4_GONPJ|nr:hypothetical protein M427DRAFT_73127 [Gonapodya prolifera JEL478]|eukprot:KXS11149.1 hypothetical protein M427DRAFT_73127 [Gonapodya prolifera JEL478]